MDNHARVEILAEILRERLPSVQRVIEEWSVPHSDPVTYAQVKDLIWEVLAPLGISMLGFSAADRAAQESTDPDILQARALFARTGEDTGRLLERLMQIADSVRP